MDRCDVAGTTLARAARWALVVLLPCALASCHQGCVLGTVALPGYPWVEHRGLSLDREVLRVVVGQGEVGVDALFEFGMHGRPVDQVMFFPVPGEGEVSGFSARLLGEGLEPVALQVARAEGPPLPVGGEVRSWDLLVPGHALAEHGARLNVTYVQQVECSFEYILRSGAYWRGPIGELLIEVVDPEHEVLEASAEGEQYSAVGTDILKWRFIQIEPGGGLRLRLACPGDGGG